MAIKRKTLLIITTGLAIGGVLFGFSTVLSLYNTSFANAFSWLEAFKIGNLSNAAASGFLTLAGVSAVLALAFLIATERTGSKIDDVVPVRISTSAYAILPEWNSFFKDSGVSGVYSIHYGTVQEGYTEVRINDFFSRSARLVLKKHAGENFYWLSGMLQQSIDYRKDSEFFEFHVYSKENPNEKFTIRAANLSDSEWIKLEELGIEVSTEKTAGKKSIQHQHYVAIEKDGTLHFKQIEPPQQQSELGAASGPGFGASQS